jgi:hypothetical protein
VNRKTITLPDGTELRSCHGDPPRGVDAVTDRTCTWRADLSALMDGDEVVREITAATATNTKAGRAARGRTTPAKGSRAKTVVTDRFACLNSFVDDVARYLEDTERSTWHTLYRHADGNTWTVEVGIDTVAQKVGRSPRSVIRALEHLTACGLLERFQRGRRQTGPSRYRLAARPADHLDRIRELAARRAAGRAPRRQRDTGVTVKTGTRDEYGRFSNMTPVTP